MRKITLPRTITFASAIALGCVSVTADAFPKSGVGSAGGHSVGHPAPSGGIASGHAGAAPHGVGGTSRAHPVDGSTFIRVGHGFVVE